MDRIREVALAAPKGRNDPDGRRMPFAGLRPTIPMSLIDGPTPEAASLDPSDNTPAPPVAMPRGAVRHFGPSFQETMTRERGFCR